MFPFQIQDENPPAYNSPQRGAAVTNQARGTKYFGLFTPNDTAVQILAANPSRTSAHIANTHASVDAFLGNDSTVTSSTGFPLPHGTTFTDLGSYTAWWAVTAGSTGEVRSIEMTN